MDTAYHGSSHRRSHSETRAPADGEALISGRDNQTVDDLYDPHTRTGRPSFARSAHNSPMLNPTIHVHEPEKLNLERGFADSNLPPRPRGPSNGEKFLARFRFVEILLVFIASATVVGVNAAILYTYNTHRDTERRMDTTDNDLQNLWAVWAPEGIDTTPISAYVGVGAANAVAALIMLFLSFRKGFRYLEGRFAQIFMLVASAAFFVGWLLISLLLQYQAMGHSNKHSFLTWTCTHTGPQFAVPSFSFANLCNLSRAGRAAGLVAVAANALVFITILLGCCSSRKSRGYTQVMNPARAWMPKWAPGAKK